MIYKINKKEKYEKKLSKTPLFCAAKNIPKFPYYIVL